jgi:cytidylate kinase
MAVITISRGTFSGGKMLAECLAENLGYRCIDRDVIVERAASRGVAQRELEDVLEKPPRYLDRYRHKKYVYLALIQAALTEEVREGRAVYHGNAGHLLLRGSHVLRTRIIAPMEFRLSMAQERLTLSRAEAADHIQRMDQDRRRWTHYLYGVDWGDPSLYDIVLNLEHMEIRGACDIIVAASRQKQFQDSPESLASMADLALSSRVRAELAVAGTLWELEFEVTARAGSVSVAGRLSSPEQADDIERLARSVPGVRELDTSRLIVKSPV